MRPKLNRKMMLRTKSMLSKHFLIVPDKIGDFSINKNPHIKSTIKQVLGLIITFNRLGMTLYMSDTQMGYELGMSRSTVIRSMNTLSRLHVINVTPVKNNKGHTIGKEVNLAFNHLDKDFDKHAKDLTKHIQGGVKKTQIPSIKLSKISVKLDNSHRNPIHKASTRSIRMTPTKKHVQNETSVKRIPHSSVKLRHHNNTRNKSELLTNKPSLNKNSSKVDKRNKVYKKSTRKSKIGKDTKSKDSGEKLNRNTKPESTRSRKTTRKSIVEKYMNNKYQPKFKKNGDVVAPTNVHDWLCTLYKGFSNRLDTVHTSESQLRRASKLISVWCSYDQQICDAALNGIIRHALNDDRIHYFNIIALVNVMNNHYFQSALDKRKMMKQRAINDKRHEKEIDNGEDYISHLRDKETHIQASNLVDRYKHLVISKRQMMDECNQKPKVKKLVIQKMKKVSF